MPVSMRLLHALGRYVCLGQALVTARLLRFSRIFFYISSFKLLTLSKYEKEHLHGYHVELLIRSVG